MFQLTHPVWGATPATALQLRQLGISIHAPRIHAPRVGCDPPDCAHWSGRPEISIHAPRVGCDCGRPPSWSITRLFQSTHPVWGATLRWYASLSANSISIHAPRVGCDAGGRPRRRERGNFNPRTPCGVRPYTSIIFLRLIIISIHAPRVGCDHHSIWSQLHP